MPRREGNRLLLDGVLTVDTVARVLEDTSPQDRAAAEVVDLAGVTVVDSARSRSRSWLREARQRTHDPVREPAARDGEARPAHAVADLIPGA
jgi:ABC-type transporter Mla MlaB component